MIFVGDGVRFDERIDDEPRAKIKSRQRPGNVQDCDLRDVSD